MRGSVIGPFARCREARIVRDWTILGAFFIFFRLPSSWCQLLLSLCEYLFCPLVASRWLGFLFRGRRSVLFYKSHYFLDSLSFQAGDIVDKPCDLFLFGDCEALSNMFNRGLSFFRQFQVFLVVVMATSLPFAPSLRSCIGRRVKV